MTDLLQENRDAQTPNPDPTTTHPFPEFPTAEKSSQLRPSSLNETSIHNTKPGASAPGLHTAQLAAIELLAQGKCFTTTAKSLGVDRRTIFNWRCNPQFQTELNRRHHEIWGQLTDRLRMLLDPSLEVLAEHLNDAYDRNRFRAASTILRLANLKNPP